MKIRWTKVRPTKEGFYWIKDEDKFVNVVKVVDIEENPFDEMDPEYEIYGGSTVYPCVFSTKCDSGTPLDSDEFNNLMWSAKEIAIPLIKNMIL